MPQKSTLCAGARSPWSTSDLDYTAHETDSNDDYAEQDDYTVEKILSPRPNASVPGGLEFKVR